MYSRLRGKIRGGCQSTALGHLPLGVYFWYSPGAHKVEAGPLLWAHKTNAKLDVVLPGTALGSVTEEGKRAAP